MTLHSVCVFCGSSPGTGGKFLAAAEALGREMLSRGLDLVYGGASVGLMGRIAETVLDGGGRAVGVMPKALVDREVAHPALTKLHVVDSMHERKALMVELGDAFVAMPGGFGTTEELFEALTWAQLGIHEKPCGILNVAGYFDSLKIFLDTATDCRFVDPNHRSLLVDAEDPAALLDLMENCRPVRVEKAGWIHHMNRPPGESP